MITETQIKPLRPYQQKAVDAVVAAKYRGVSRVLYTAPTGTGKTRVFVGIVEALGLKRPALILAHREELLQQASDRISEIIPSANVQIECGSQRAKEGSDVVIASIQSVGREGSSRLGWLNPGLIICDEAHHSTASGYKRAFERFGAFDGRSFLVGTTATPKRLDRMNLKSIFEEHVFDYPIREAMNDGWLCDILGYSVQTHTDLTKVRTVAGDYNQAELAKAVNNYGRTGSAIHAWKETAVDRKTIVFCVDVAHSQDSAQMWRDAGYSAECVHGAMGKESRQDVFARFRSGDIQVLTNCEIATEGLDVPEVSCVVMLRPTQSWALFCQMIGRGLRPVKPNCVVLDLVDNTNKNNLATVPTILDLPPGMDLEGKSLKAAAEILDELGEKLSFLENYDPASFSELETTFSQIDILGRLKPNAVVQANSRLAWIALPGGRFTLSCGTGKKADLAEDGLGMWWLRMKEGEQEEKRRVVNDMQRALHAADVLVSIKWPEAQWLGSQSASWRRNIPSEKQIACLCKFGYAESVVRAMSRGEASSLITMKISGIKR
jgi:superfamily II DNA or RNA helicase